MKTLFENKMVIDMLVASTVEIGLCIGLMYSATILLRILCGASMVAFAIGLAIYEVNFKEQ